MELLELEPEVQLFAVERRVIYLCFPYISTMRKTNLIFKFSLDPLEFGNSRIHGIAGIGT